MVCFPESTQHALVVNQRLLVTQQASNRIATQPYSCLTPCLSGHKAVTDITNHSHFVSLRFLAFSFLACYNLAIAAPIDVTARTNCCYGFVFSASMDQFTICQVALYLVLHRLKFGVAIHPYMRTVTQSPLRDCFATIRSPSRPAINKTVLCWPVPTAEAYGLLPTLGTQLTYRPFRVPRHC
jgi:hypothetical protein